MWRNRDTHRPQKPAATGHEGSTPSIRTSTPRAEGRLLGGSAHSTTEGRVSGPQSSWIRSPGFLPLLRHAEVVARRVAETGVDAVRLLRRLLRELDAAALELLVAPL